MLLPTNYILHYSPVLFFPLSSALALIDNTLVWVFLWRRTHTTPAFCSVTQRKLTCPGHLRGVWPTSAWTSECAIPLPHGEWSRDGLLSQIWQIIVARLHWHLCKAAFRFLLVLSQGDHLQEERTFKNEAGREESNLTPESRHVGPNLPPCHSVTRPSEVSVDANLSWAFCPLKGKHSWL